MVICIITWTIIFIVVNFVSAVIGLVLFGSGIRDFFFQEQYKEIVDVGHLNTLTIIAITVGLVQFLISYIGFCGAVKLKKFALIVYAIILMVLIGAQIMIIGATIWCVNSDCAEDLEHMINKTFENVNGSDATINIIQILFYCCGAENISATYHNDTLPSSCCGYFLNQTCNRKDAFQDGCQIKLRKWLIDKAIWMISLLLTLIVIEMACVIVAIFIAVYNYEDDFW